MAGGHDAQAPLAATVAVAVIAADSVHDSTRFVARAFHGGCVPASWLVADVVDVAVVCGPPWFVRVIVAFDNSHLAAPRFDAVGALRHSLGHGPRLLHRLVAEIARGGTERFGVPRRP